MSLITFAKRVGDSIEMVNKHQIKEFLNEEGNKGYKGEYVVEIKRARKVRTLPQNNSLHLFFEKLADKFNEKNITVQLFLSKVIELEWTPEIVKEIAWRPLQRLLTGKKSTTDLFNTGEIDEVYDHLNKHLGQTYEIYIPFPSKENQHENNS